MKASVLLVAAAAFVATGAAAQSDVLKAKGCLNCHGVDTKKAGPALKDIAAKYKDNKSAEADLVAKLKSGKGHPKVSASEADIKAAVEATLAVR